MSSPWDPTFLPFDDVFTLVGDYRNITSPVATADTNVASVQVLTGFVDLIPRVPAGFVFYKNWQVVGQNSVQSLGFPTAQTAGTLTVTFNTHTTPSQPYNVSAATLQAALQALPSIGAGNVSVTIDPITLDWDIEFIGALAAAPQNPLSAASVGTSASIEVGLIQDGIAPITRSTGFALDIYYQARIWTNGQLSTINQADTESIQLPANSTEVVTALEAAGVTTGLIYDVRFRNVVFGDTTQNSLANFAFNAPAIGNTVTLTDPNLTRLPYAAAYNVPILA